MISIVTAVHNQIGMNRLFYETLKRNTRNVYELIIIDNNSTDGSREFFREHADTVIENPGNYSYIVRIKALPPPVTTISCF